MRIAVGLEYDGTAYNGWQRQRSGTGIQQFVEQALSSIADEDVEVTCAGRTDAGVHATGQVAHFETGAERSERSWILGANSELPDDIGLCWARRVDDEFHARFSATARRYRYRILNRLVRSPLQRYRAWWVHRPLDARAMHHAAQQLVGEHDFSAFRAAGCQAKSATRNVVSIGVDRSGDLITVDIKANAFLQHMVRNITGTLVAVGGGDEDANWVREVLESRDRGRGGVAAPPHGLTLVEVCYPEAYRVPVCGARPEW